MSLASHPNISWCLCASQAVFLDLERDRYFCLPEPLDALFQRWVAGEAIDRDAHAALVATGVAYPDPTQRPQAGDFFQIGKPGPDCLADVIFRFSHISFLHRQHSQLKLIGAFSFLHGHA